MSDDDAILKSDDDALNAGVGKIWAVYQRFRSLGASESEAARLAEAVMKGVVASIAMRAGKPS